MQQQPPTATLPDRVAALELLVHNLVFILEAEGAIPTGTLDAWLATATGRMRATGSVPAATVDALDTLREQIAQ